MADNIQKKTYAILPRLKLLCVNFETVIPTKAGIQLQKTGFRVKPGMTIKKKSFLRHLTIYFRPSAMT